MDKLTKTLKSGHTVEMMSEEDIQRIQTHFQSYENAIRLQPGGWYFEGSVIDILERIHDFKHRPSDVFIVAYPKSGITWTQEVLWCFLHNPNLDNPEANLILDLRSTHIEADLFMKFKHGPRLAEGAVTLKDAVRKVDPDRVTDPHLLFTYTELCLKDRRLIKAHLPISLLPRNAIDDTKVIYIARDPRDQIISRFHYMNFFKVHKMSCSFDEFLDFVLKEEVMYSPHWLHLKEAWDLRHHPNVLFVKYEDMLMNPFKEYAKINEFLDTHLTEFQINNIIEYTSFANMKKLGGGDEARHDGGNLVNKDVQKITGGFFRKGKSGGWRDGFTPEQINKLNNWIKKSTKDFPKDFPYLISD